MLFMFRYTGRSFAVCDGRSMRTMSTSTHACANQKPQRDIQVDACPNQNADMVDLVRVANEVQSPRKVSARDKG